MTLIREIIPYKFGNIFNFRSMHLMCFRCIKHLGWVMGLFVVVNLGAQTPTYTYITSKTIQNFVSEAYSSTIQPPLTSSLDSIHLLLGNPPTNVDSLNIGIWSDSIIAADSYLSRLIVCYTSDFQPFFVFRFHSSATIYPIGIVDSTLYFGARIQHTYYNFESSPPLSPALPPPLSPNGDNLDQFVFGLNPYTHEAKLVYVIQNPASILELQPFDRYMEMTGLRQNLIFKGRYGSILLNESNYLITDILAHEVNTVVWDANTLPLLSATGSLHQGMVRYDLITEEMTIDSYGACDNTNQFNYSLFPSSAGDSYYKVGNFTGEPCEIDPAGTNFSIDITDSIAHVFTIFYAKAQNNGASEWVRPLYTYHRKTENSSIPSQPLRSYIVPTAVQEIDNQNFLSLSLRFLTLGSDSLFMKNVFGHDTIVNFGIPAYDSPGNYEYYSYAANELYAFNSDGSPDKSLIRPLGNYLGIFFRGHQSLFKLDDQLIWILDYANQNDTTETLILESTSGTQYLPLYTPAGRGKTLLWLSTDFEIVDQWNIPISSSTNQDADLRIACLQPYKGDTILIEAAISGNSTVNMNPFNDSNWVNIDSKSTIYAFYKKNSLNTISKIPESHEIVIFPNPLDENLNVKLNDSDFTEYQIIDITGRLLQLDNINRQTQNLRINVSRLPSGIYLLHLRGKETSATTKFVVR